MSTNTIPATSPQILGRIAQHLADGTLEVPVQHTYDFAPAPEATQALAATHTRASSRCASPDPQRLRHQRREPDVRERHADLPDGLTEASGASFGSQQWCGRRRTGLHRFIDVKGSSGSGVPANLPALKGRWTQC